MARCIIAVLPASSSPSSARSEWPRISAARLMRGALLVQQLLPEDDGPGVAAVQEVIGGEQHQALTSPLSCLSALSSRRSALGVSCWPCLVVRAR